MPILINKKCIIYCRVPSKEQEDRGYSLEAQEGLLKGYAENKSLDVVKIFKITESASGKQIRKIFNEMLRHVKKSKISIILCEKIDRLTRNLKDGATVSDWLNEDEIREVHFVKENFIVNKNTRAHENLVWDMKVAIARFYTNNLSEEVKKGQKAKIESGWMPMGAKLGYKISGEQGHKMQLIDEKTAPFIKRIFELYSTGNYTISQLVRKMEDEGLKNTTGKPLGHSSLHMILSNPFYCGSIRWNGEIYRGKHEPIISEEIFDEVQDKLKRKLKAGKFNTHTHVFKGMIKCGHCGCLITWETQKGHHYGHCKGFKPCDNKDYIRQEKIEEQIFDLLVKVAPKNERVLAWIKKALKDSLKDKVEYSKEKIEALKKGLILMENRLDKIYEDKLDGVISAEFFNKKFKEYTAEKEKINKEMSKFSQGGNEYYEAGIAIHDLAYRAKDIYLSNKATDDDRRLLLSYAFSKMTLTNGILTTEYSPAFEFLSKFMDRLNATSEPVFFGSYYRKADAFATAYPDLLGDRDSNPD